MGVVFRVSLAGLLLAAAACNSDDPAEDADQPSSTQGDGDDATDVGAGPVGSDGGGDAVVGDDGDGDGDGDGGLSGDDDAGSDGDGDGMVDAGGIDAGTDAAMPDAGPDSRCAADCEPGGGVCVDSVCEHGLLAYWPFDEDTGVTTKDRVEGLACMLEGASWATGVRGAGIRFGSGKNAWVDCGDILNDASLPLTVSVWVYADRAQSAALLMSEGPWKDTYYGYWLQIEDDRTINFSLGNGGPSMPSSRASRENAGRYPLAQWVHVAAVATSPEDIHIYVDGSDAGGDYGGTATTMANAMTNFVLGVKSMNGDAYFVGTLDELRIYDRALTADEVEALADKP